MAFLDDVPAHPDPAPMVLDYTKIVDGLKWKTVMAAEKEAYRQRLGLADAIDDEVYIFTCLIDYFKGFKKEQEAKKIMDAKRAEMIAAQQALDTQIDELKIEFN